MLKLVPSSTFKLDILIPLPQGTEAKVKMEFKHLSRSKLEAWLKSTNDEDGEAARKDSDALRDVLVGWSGIDAEFNDENLELLLDNYPSASRSIINAYLPALLEGKTKNSSK